LSIVIDASVALAWVFGDERHDTAWAIIDRLTQGAACAPALFPLEVANGLLVAHRRGRLSPEQTRSAVVLLEALPIEVDLETPQQAFGAIWALASRHQLSSYDAAYLELAVRRALPIATLDARLARAARAEGLHLALAAT
jgi:predicted nucleic acid-binding protein